MIDRSIKKDKVTESIITIDYAHHEIHDGDHFYYTDSVEVASGNSQDYLIITAPIKYMHLIMILDGSAITQFQLYESSDRDGTSQQTILNNYRSSSRTSGAQIWKTSTGGTTDGTLIFQYKGGSATNQSRSGGGVRSDEELILKRNTKYILRVTSSTNNNLINIGLGWYEK